MRTLGELGSARQSAQREFEKYENNGMAGRAREDEDET